MESKLFDTKERSRRSSKGAERHKTERLLSVEHELIECQRRLIDDLEFTQLEVGRFSVFYHVLCKIIFTYLIFYIFM